MDVNEISPSTWKQSLTWKQFKELVDKELMEEYGIDDAPIRLIDVIRPSINGVAVSCGEDGMVVS